MTKYPYSVTRWRSTALSAGWKSYHWPRLACIINRESHGIPTVVGDHGTSFGLTQIHVPAWRWLMKKLQLTSAQLKNGWINLRVAFLIYKQRGWQPWSGGRYGC